MDLGAGFQPTCMAHPDTYLNKVVVGGNGGRMQLWNFAKGMLLHSFQLGDGGADIRTLAPSPALDVVGIGMSDGCAKGLAHAQLQPFLWMPYRALRCLNCACMELARRGQRPDCLRVGAHLPLLSAGQRWMLCLCRSCSTHLTGAYIQVCSSGHARLPNQRGLWGSRGKYAAG